MKMEALLTAIAANVPVLLVGPPGVGKTSALYALAEKNGAHLEVIIASLRDPTDFAGLPIRVVQNNQPSVYMAPPKWARNLVEAIEAGKPAWVLIDEASTAPPATQAAFLRLAVERVCGELPLGPEVRMLFAANPADQAAGGWDLAAPLANRLFHLPWSTTASEWAEGIMTGFPSPPTLNLPKDWERLIPKKMALISGYVRSAGSEALINVPKDDAKSGGPWPSPRTWTMAGRLLAAREAAAFDDDLDTILLRGTVGEGAAIQYMEWIKAQDLPDPEQLLADPDSFQLPERGDIAYTVLNSVVGAAIANLTPTRWEAAWKILKIAGEQGALDVGAAAARVLATHHKPNLPPPHQYVKPYIPMLVDAGLLKLGGQR